MIKVVIFGVAGRMGSLVASGLNEIDDIQLVSGVECPGHYTIGSAIREAPVIADGVEIPAADAWIDFSIAGSALDHIRLASKLNIPIVVAATGFSHEDQTTIKSLAAHCPVLLAPNLSQGIGAMNKLLGDAANLLGEDFEPVICELHHSAKRDAPSGTAIHLSQQLKRTDRNVQITALRAGGAIGEHQVRFVGKNEELVITHRAWSRRAFSEGVPRAVRFIVQQKPGLYSIHDMYQIS